MATQFQINDPSLETQWRAIILFGKNSATYKFAFAKALTELLDRNKTTLSLAELAGPFFRHMIEHLKVSDKQGSSGSSQFLDACRAFVSKQISEDELVAKTTKLGFVNVVDAFQNVNGDVIKSPFYYKKYIEYKKKIILTDSRIMAVIYKYIETNIEYCYIIDSSDMCRDLNLEKFR